MYTVIFTAERHDCTAMENTVRTRKLGEYLNKVYKLVRPCTGCYTEQETRIVSVECGFMVSLLSTGDVHELHELAMDFEQESILVVNDSTKESELHLANNVVSVGKWTEVDRYTALCNGAYTYNHKGEYFICIKEDGNGVN